MSFVNKHQIVALEAIHCYRLVAILLCQLVDVYYINSLTFKDATTTLLCKKLCIKV